MALVEGASGLIIQRDGQQLLDYYMIMYDVCNKHTTLTQFLECEVVPISTANRTYIVTMQASFGLAVTSCL